MSRFCVVLAAAVAAWVGLAVGGCTRQISDKDIRFATLGEVQALTESSRANAVLLVDPRPAGEFAAGRLPGARNLSLTAVPDGSGTRPELERYGQLIVYGNDPGTASARAMTKRLMSVGYKNVRLFVGGLSEWQRAGLPVERDEGAGDGGG